MRILQVHNRHATRGGADDVLDAEHAALTGAGHDVDRFLGEAAGSRDRSRAGQAVDAVWNREAAAALTARLRGGDVDLVHVHTPFPVLSPAVLRVAHRHAPTVATVHSYRYACIAGTLHRDGRVCEDCVGSRLKTAGLRHRCYHDSLAGSLALTASLAVHRTAGTFRHHVDRFVTLTRFGRDVLAREGVPVAQVAVKPNAVPAPPRATAPPDGPPRVLFIGRLVGEKGVAEMLAAWEQVAAHAAGSGAELRVAGDGPMRALVDRVAARVSSVRVLGWLDEAGLAAELEACRLVVVPSTWHEAGPPLVLLQALAHGRAAVCSDLDNISATAVSAGAARTFRTGDADAMARCLLGALADPVWTAAAGAGARGLYAREHAPDRSLARLEQVYADASAHHARCRTASRTSSGPATAPDVDGDAPVSPAPADTRSPS